MSDFKIINMTLGQLLDKQAKEYPDTEAIVFADRNFRLTYRQFKNEADKLAKGLIAVGVKKGNHVAVWAQNVPHWI
nr:AMP-binding protein [bacterium]